MHPTLRIATRALGLGLGLAAFAGPALAQFGPPPPPTPQSGPARVWNDQIYTTDDAVLSADLAIGGTGAFTGVLRRATGELCYVLNAPAVDGPTAAHIHLGGPGESGAAVVPLATPAGGTSGGCVALRADVARALLANPGGYYVNVHNAAYPGGAARGQLQADRG